MELGYALDLVLDENSSLREEISQLREWVVTLRQQFGIHRFAASDKGTVIAGRSCNNRVDRKCLGWLKNSEVHGI